MNECSKCHHNPSNSCQCSTKKQKQNPPHGGSCGRDHHYLDAINKCTKFHDDLTKVLDQLSDWKKNIITGAALSCGEYFGYSCVNVLTVTVFKWSHNGSTLKCCYYIAEYIVGFQITSCGADVDAALLCILALHDLTAYKLVVSMEVHGLHLLPVLVQH